MLFKRPAVQVLAAGHTAVIHAVILAGTVVIAGCATGVSGEEAAENTGKLHGIVLKVGDRAILCSHRSADCLIVSMALIEAAQTGLVKTVDKLFQFRAVFVYKI
jgi:hypothetical protein